MWGPRWVSSGGRGRGERARSETSGYKRRCNTRKSMRVRSRQQLPEMNKRKGGDSEDEDGWGDTGEVGGQTNKRTKKLEGAWSCIQHFHFHFFT